MSNLVLPTLFVYTKALATLISKTAILISISQHFLLIKLIIVTVIGMSTHSFGIVPSPIYWFGALLVDLLMLLGCVGAAFCHLTLLIFVLILLYIVLNTSVPFKYGTVMLINNRLHGNMF
jgi:hypothetical protein